MSAFFQWKRLLISTKTGIICCLVVILLLTAIAGVILSVQSKLVKSVISTTVSELENTFTDQTLREKSTLRKNVEINSQICADMAADYLYNFDPDGLINGLKGFMALPEIQGIKVTDNRHKLFAMAWRENGKSKYGTNIPKHIQFDGKLATRSDVKFNKELMGKVIFYYTEKLITDHLEAKKIKFQTGIQSLILSTEKRINRSIIIQLISFGVVVFALLLSITISLRIIVIKPIKHVIHSMKDIAEGEGDLTRRLEVRNEDEIGELGHWFNVFIQNVQEIIRDVVNVVGELRASSTNLNDISGILNSSSEHTTRKAHAVSTSADQMSQNMRAIAVSMEQASTNIDVVTSSTSEMSNTIEEIAGHTEKTREITQEAVSCTDDATHQVNDLGNAANDIGIVIETITEISEQVNLLALNATIEAARAGESGRGFAVVANEIKELARQTANATDEIRIRVEKIQNTTDGTITQIGRISGIVTDVNTLVDSIATAISEQSAMTSEISLNVSQIFQGVSEININVTQTNQASETVSEEIEVLSNESGQIANSSSQVNLSAHQLGEYASQLNQLVGRFKI